MRIGLNIGHIGSQGAIGFLNELQCNIEVVRALTPMLESLNHTVIDCSVAHKTIDYVKSTEFANTQKLDLLISVHFNSFKDKGANGTEVLFASAKGREYASAIVVSLSKEINTYNRGAKQRNDLYILSKTNCVAVLVECLFVSNQEDCKEYDANKIATGIARSFGYTDRKAEKKEHWAKAYYDTLIKDGMQISEQRFDDPITRGEVFALLAKMRGAK